MYEQYEKEDNTDFEFDNKLEIRGPYLSESGESSNKTDNSAEITGDRTRDSEKKSVIDNKNEVFSDDHIINEQENKIGLSELIVADVEEDDKVSEMDPTIRSPTPEPRRRKSSLYKAPSLVVVPPSKTTSIASNKRRFNTPEPERRKSFLPTYDNKSLQDVSNDLEQSSNQTSSMRDLRKSTNKRISTPKTAVKNLFNRFAQPKKKQEKLRISSSTTTRRSSNTKLPLRANLSVSSAGSTDVELNDTSLLLGQDSDAKKRGKKTLVSPAPSTSTSRSVSPVPSKTSQKGNSSPSRPASRSAGMISPSTTTKVKTLDSKTSKLQSNTNKKKATSSQTPVSVGKETKQTVQSKKLAVSKSPNVRKTSTNAEKQTLKSAPTQKLMKKTSPKPGAQNKNEKLVEAKAHTNQNKEVSVNQNSNKSASEMKETNLSDDKTKTEIVQKQPSDVNFAAASPTHSAVQMNRAARLRLLKKTQSPTSKGISN